MEPSCRNHSLGLSAHAAVRMQQRGIRRHALELLMAYGAEAFDHRGGTILYLDRPARARIRRAAGAGRAPDDRADVYAVLGPDGRVLTVGHRHRRIPRC